MRARSCADAFEFGLKRRSYSALRLALAPAALLHLLCADSCFQLWIADSIAGLPVALVTPVINTRV